MPDHFHLISNPRDGRIKEFVGALKSLSAKSIVRVCKQFLLPYKSHFFVCEADVIRALGLEPDDPDWEKIGWDVAQPADLEACERLRQKRSSLPKTYEG